MNIAKLHYIDDPDKVPEATEILEIILNTRFGEYTAEVTWNNNELLYVRRYIHLYGEFPPEDYPDYHAVNKLVAKADRNKAVLKKECHWSSLYIIILPVAPKTDQA